LYMGQGKRLAPYTTVLPKPLLPVGDMPILEIVIRQLKNYGITEIIFCVGYLGTLLEAYFGSGTKFGVNISYSYEKEPLGTAGPLALVDGLSETFLVMNGDILTTIDYTQMVKFHKDHGEIATIGLTRKDINIDLGVIDVNSDATLKTYTEKPILKYLVSMGIYLFEPTVLKYIKSSVKLDLPDLVSKLTADRNRVMGYESDCIWLDVGRPEDHTVATEVFCKERWRFLNR
jgi:NDP-mannose synthase